MVWALRWFALWIFKLASANLDLGLEMVCVVVDFSIGFSQSCPTFHKLPVKYQLEMTLMGFKWASHPSNSVCRVQG
jgi:hypothetical protein